MHLMYPYVYTHLLIIPSFWESYVLFISMYPFKPHVKKKRLETQMDLFLNNRRRQALGILDVDGLDIRVQLLFRTLLIVTLATDANTETEGDTLDTAFPDLLVQLRVKTDILGAL